MKYIKSYYSGKFGEITFNYKDAGYTTENYTEEELEKLCKEWEEEDNDGTTYFLIEE